MSNELKRLHISNVERRAKVDGDDNSMAKTIIGLNKPHSSDDAELAWR